MRSNTRRVIVAGSRGFTDYSLAERVLDELLPLKWHSMLEIVSGTAPGADRMGERWAQEHGVDLTKFPATWTRADGSVNRQAGFERNLRMLAYATHLIAFWDGKSRGTAQVTDEAEANGLPFKVVRYDVVS